MEELLSKEFFQNKNNFLRKVSWCRTIKGHLNPLIWVLRIYHKKKEANLRYLRFLDNILQLIQEIIKNIGMITVRLINYQNVRKLLNSYKIKDKSYMKYRIKIKIENKNRIYLLYPYYSIYFKIYSSLTIY